MVKEKKNEILVSIIIIVASIIIVGGLAFGYYEIFIPQGFNAVIKEYEEVDMSLYAVDANALSGTWLGAIDYSLNKEDLEKYENLKEYYQGRDNPFVEQQESKEKIILFTEEEPEEESKKDENQKEKNSDEVEIN